MRPAKHGDTVKIHYRGRLYDKSEFDASFDREPLEFTIGEGEVISGLEDAVLGMNPGDSKTTDVPVEKGFGPHREDLVGEVAKSKFAHWEREPTVGERVPISQPDGTPIDVTVTAVSETKVTVDANHPLAGEELILDIELIDIVQEAH
jgi:FKBP-type peptidyl-prolyl cis-trans isomerase 2